MALSRKEQLEQEIAEKMAQLNGLEELESAVIPLKDYTTEDKVKFFDKFYNFVNDVVKEVESSGYQDEDTSYWFYEEGMSILNINDTKALWKYYNSLTN